MCYIKVHIENRKVYLLCVTHKDLVLTKNILRKYRCAHYLSFSNFDSNLSFVSEKFTVPGFLGRFFHFLIRIAKKFNYQGTAINFGAH